MRQAFRAQAEYCDRLGSRFTGALCATLAETLSMDSESGRLALTWAGDPSPMADGLPLRVTGSLHALVRSGRAPELAAIYPPHDVPTPVVLADVLGRVLIEHGAEIGAFLRHTPQTNEVGRSAVLIGGLLEIAKCTGLPLALFEIGASAGLNLLPDQYRYRLGAADWGPPEARVRLAPEWTGGRVGVEAPFSVQIRRGCDINPIDIHDADQRDRLRSYVWPDQPERLDRLDAAIDTALAVDFSLDRADAADWVEAVLVAEPPPGVARVLYHSIVWSYLSEATRTRVLEHINGLGRMCSSRAPFAWLRFELEPQHAEARLRLSMWPGGTEQVLAAAHPHGASIQWRATA